MVDWSAAARLTTVCKLARFYSQLQTQCFLACLVACLLAWKTFKNAEEKKHSKSEKEKKRERKWVRYVEIEKERMEPASRCVVFLSDKGKRIIKQNLLQQSLRWWWGWCCIASERAYDLWKFARIPRTAKISGTRAPRIFGGGRDRGRRVPKVCICVWCVCVCVSVVCLQEEQEERKGRMLRTKYAKSTKIRLRFCFGFDFFSSICSFDDILCRVYTSSSYLSYVQYSAVLCSALRNLLLSTFLYDHVA